MRVTVIGAGAMGSIFGLALARAGVAVAFLDTRADQVEAIARDGLVVRNALGEQRLRAPAATDPSALPKADAALVLVDANATAAAARSAAQCLKPEGFALTLQNGIGNVEALVAALGAARVLAGSTYNSGATLGLARAAHTNRGPTWLGEVDGSVTPRARDMAGRFSRSGLTTEISPNIMGVVWSKFVHNCAINPVSAATGLRPGEIARDAAAARRLDLLLAEILAVVERAGIVLPEHDPGREIRDHCWERYNKPSMLQHLESGRVTEIDALNGALVRKARELGVAVPANEAMVAEIKSLEGKPRRTGRAVDEAELEAAARADPRGERWGRA